MVIIPELPIKITYNKPLSTSPLYIWPNPGIITDNIADIVPFFPDAVPLSISLPILLFIFLLVGKIRKMMNIWIAKKNIMITPTTT